MAEEVARVPAQLSHWLTAWHEASPWYSLALFSWPSVKWGNGLYLPEEQLELSHGLQHALWFIHKRHYKKANCHWALQTVYTPIIFKEEMKILHLQKKLQQHDVLENVQNQSKWLLIGFFFQKLEMSFTDEVPAEAKLEKTESKYLALESGKDRRLLSHCILKPSLRKL